MLIMLWRSHILSVQLEVELSDILEVKLIRAAWSGVTPKCELSIKETVARVMQVGES